MNSNETTYCVNCNTPLNGKYCHCCGQKKVASEDKKISHFINEFISTLFIADSKIWATFRFLVTQPGELTKTYIGGNRKKFWSPLKLFFFANLLYFLFPFLNTFSTNLNSQLNQQVYSPFIKEIVKEHIVESETTYDAFRVKFENKSTSYGKLLLIVLVLLQALFLQVLFVRNKQYYFVDFLAASAYFTSFYILVLLVIFPALINVAENVFGDNIIIILSNELFSVLLLLSILVYLTVLLKKAFETKYVEASIKALLLTLFIIPSFIAYRFILFWVTFLL